MKNYRETNRTPSDKIYKNLISNTSLLRTNNFEPIKSTIHKS